jgi:hypothetical protein
MSREIAVPEELPGPHHCIGTARTVIEVFFRSLRARCMAHGGNLPQDELDDLCSQFMDSFACGFDLFELRHDRCMKASLRKSDTPFARERILATLLRTCAENSARASFPLQIERLGIEWINDLIEGMASYVRRRIGANLDTRLVDAYVATAGIPNIKLTVAELLKQQAVKDALLECARAFEVAATSATIVNELCHWVNKAIAERRNAVGAQVCKITEKETRDFLFLLPQEIGVTVTGAVAPSG